VPDGARSAAENEPLRTSDPVHGALSGLRFAQHECPVPQGARLFLLTDGAFEIQKSDGSMLEFEEFLELLAASRPSGVAELDRLVGVLRSLHGPGPLDDDLSIIRFEL
jgi:sigma-B regulation protein RsbU (phosphoserine phosphatase)